MQKTFPVGLIATICVFSLNILNVTGQWYFPVVYKKCLNKISNFSFLDKLRLFLYLKLIVTISILVEIQLDQFFCTEFL